MALFGLPFLQYNSAITSYSTTFPNTENPISEGGIWLSRSSSRTVVRTTTNKAFGTQTGSGGYDDSYAYVAGNWSADTEATATIFNLSPSGIQEVELLFRVTDTLGGPNVTCYEMNVAFDGSYANCYAWQGPANLVTDFRQIAGSSISGGALNGYKLKGRCQGNTLSLWVDKNDGNGFQSVFSVNDTGGGGGAQFLTGNPGIGFYREAASGAANQFGFSQYSVVAL